MSDEIAKFLIVGAICFFWLYSQRPKSFYRKGKKSGPAPKPPAAPPKPGLAKDRNPIEWEGVRYGRPSGTEPNASDGPVRSRHGIEDGDRIKYPTGIDQPGHEFGKDEGALGMFY